MKKRKDVEIKKAGQQKERQKKKTSKTWEGNNK